MQALVAELVATYRRRAARDHDVEEALLLADRVFVLKEVASPWMWRSGSAVRGSGGPAFDDLRNRLLAELGVVEPNRWQPLVEIEEPTANGAAAPN